MLVKAYDIRGEPGIDIDAQIAYRIGRSVAQHFNAKKTLWGGTRETSAEFGNAVSRGIIDAGGDVLDIGMSGSEEM